MVKTVKDPQQKHFDSLPCGIPGGTRAWLFYLGGDPAEHCRSRGGEAQVEGPRWLLAKGFRKTSRGPLTLPFQPLKCILRVDRVQVGLCVKKTMKSVSSGCSVWPLNASPFPEPLRDKIRVMQSPEGNSVATFQSLYLDSEHSHICPESHIQVL